MNSGTDTQTDGAAQPRSITIYIVFAALLLAFIQAYALLSPILLSFLLIILITLAVNPIIAGLRIWTGSRKMATGMALLGVVAIGALAIWATIVPLRQSFETISDKLPTYWERLQRPLIKMEQQAVLTEEKLQEEVSEEIARETPVSDKTPKTDTNPPSRWPKRPQPSQSPETPSKNGNGEGSLRSSLVGMIQGVSGQIKGVTQSTTEMLVIFVTVFFGVTFSLMNPRPVIGAVFSVVPERHHATALTIMVQIAHYVPRWAVAVLISMLTIGSLFFILMWPIFGIADAIMLGLVACLLSAIPYMGPVLTLIPALLLALGEGGMTPLWVLLAYCAVQVLEGNVIIPFIMSRGMNLHPVAVIFSMLLSIAAFGVLGVLIATPLVAIVGIVHKEVYRKHYLPSVTDDDLSRLARKALLEETAIREKA